MLGRGKRRQRGAGSHGSAEPSPAGTGFVSLPGRGARTAYSKYLPASSHPAENPKCKFPLAGGSEFPAESSRCRISKPTRPLRALEGATDISSFHTDGSFLPFTPKLGIQFMLCTDSKGGNR